MPEITMPRLSDTMEDGVVSAWLKQVGDKITRGEILAEIETDKALMELEAYEDGVLERILVEPGARVPIGEPIAIVGDGSGAAASGRGDTGGGSSANAAGGDASGVTSASGGVPGATTAAPAGGDASGATSGASARGGASGATTAALAGGDASGATSAGVTRGVGSGAASAVAPGFGDTSGATTAATPGFGDASGATGAATPARGDVAEPAHAVSSEPTAHPAHAGDTRGAVESRNGATESGERMKSSPLARKIARELGVDIATVVGTGPGGRVTRQDVEAAHRTAESAPVMSASTPTTPDSAPVVPMSAPSAPAAVDYDEVPLSNIQRVSAKRLTESKQQAPHIYLTSAIDVTDLLAFRADINRTLEEAGKTKVSVNDLLVKAVATALRADPSVNVSFADGKLLRHHGIHLGVAVATPAGLLVPVIRDADRKSVSEIAAETRDKAERARDRKLRVDEMSGGTFTLSNLGMFGIEQFTAVINPPESAILAIGAAKDELRLNNSEVVSRKILRVTLSADHRSIDGAVAARFLQQLTELLEHPLRIIT
ncbi:2-oxo acid dehydrogenase subunit E2 [Nocardia sp. NPDC050406]|uniref:2-oxo acid dehydrogenase subunit E2 n=1 Tax=Nocardia sp. NPDC050406 TaxID=3364318 RepID=UPI003790B424